eukprot:6459012-Amphidinium_carterae.2
MEARTTCADLGRSFSDVVQQSEVVVSELQQHRAIPRSCSPRVSLKLPNRALLQIDNCHVEVEGHSHDHEVVRCAGSPGRGLKSAAGVVFQCEAKSFSSPRHCCESPMVICVTELLESMMHQPAEQSGGGFAILAPKVHSHTLKQAAVRPNGVILDVPGPPSAALQPRCGTGQCDRGGIDDDSGGREAWQGRGSRVREKEPHRLLCFIKHYERLTEEACRGDANELVSPYRLLLQVAQPSSHLRLWHPEGLTYPTRMLVSIRDNAELEVIVRHIGRPMHGGYHRMVKTASVTGDVRPSHTALARVVVVGESQEGRQLLIAAGFH